MLQRCNHPEFVRAYSILHEMFSIIYHPRNWLCEEATKLFDKSFTGYVCPLMFYCFFKRKVLGVCVFFFYTLHTVECRPYRIQALTALARCTGRRQHREGWPRTGSRPCMPLRREWCRQPGQQGRPHREQDRATLPWPQQVQLRPGQLQPCKPAAPRAWRR